MNMKDKEAHKRKNDKIDFIIRVTLGACLLVPITYILAMAFFNGG